MANDVSKIACLLYLSMVDERLGLDCAAILSFFTAVRVAQKATEYRCSKVASTMSQYLPNGSS